MLLCSSRDHFLGKNLFPRLIVRVFSSMLVHRRRKGVGCFFFFFFFGGGGHPPISLEGAGGEHTFCPHPNNPPTFSFNVCVGLVHICSGNSIRRKPSNSASMYE